MRFQIKYHCVFSEGLKNCYAPHKSAFCQHRPESGLGGFSFICECFFFFKNYVHSTSVDVLMAVYFIIPFNVLGYVFASLRPPLMG